MKKNGRATEVFHNNGLTVTVTGIPAIQSCSRCDNAVLDVTIAQQVDELVQPLLTWSTHPRALPAPVVIITFPALAPRPKRALARLRKAG